AFVELRHLLLLALGTCTGYPGLYARRVIRSDTGLARSGAANVGKPGTVTSDTSSLSHPQRQAERIPHASGYPWLARSGLAARGVVFGVIGVLALKLAVGDGGKATNQQGALQTIAHGTFGKFLLVILALGLAGYAIWRLVRAALGH